MRLTRRTLAATLAALTASLAGTNLATAQPDAENSLIITLKDGEVVVDLLPELAPRHVERIKTLARMGAYDDVAFHRVIDGFMAQTGDVRFGDMEDGFDPRRAGTGGSDMPDLPAEFSNEPFLRGTIGMARAQPPDSANSQFFIMFDEGRFLDGQYTVVGIVRNGMEFVDNIKRGSTARNGAVEAPDRMITVTVAADR